MNPRPNILFIDCHDLGQWLRCYGHPWLKTPSIDRLAAEGALFENVIACAPICMPSRASLYTGRMPHQAGVVGQLPLHQSEVCLPERLRREGYQTVLAGTLKIRNHVNWAGFERSLAAEVAEDEAAIQFLNAWDPAVQTRPFFLMVSFDHVHRPFGAGFDPKVAERLHVPGYLPDVPEVRRDLAALSRYVEALDAKVGRILKALRTLSVGDDTLVFLTTDHGPAVARAKHTLYDAGLKCALIVSHPATIPPGRRLPQLLSNADVMPTLLELVGCKSPAGLHGRSFACLLDRAVGTAAGPPERSQGSRICGRSAVFSEHTWGRRSGQWYYAPSRCVRTATFKYIRNYSGVPFYVDNGWLARFGDDYQLVEASFGTPLPPEELYHLPSDPDERANRMGDETFSQELRNLRLRLNTHLHATHDPIREGPVPNGEGHPHRAQWISDGAGRWTIAPGDPLDPREVPAAAMLPLDG